MRERSSERVLNELRAELILKRDRHAAVIENFSATGMYIRTEPVNGSVVIIPDDRLNVKFQIPSRETFETLDLTCRVKWSHTIESGGCTILLGLEITDIPPVYEQFYNVLFLNYGLKRK